ncbi:hypothetical protein [Streptomyces sp. NPDC054756]
MIFTVALGSDGLGQLTSTADPSFNGSAGSAASVEGEAVGCEAGALELPAALGSVAGVALVEVEVRAVWLSVAHPADRTDRLTTIVADTARDPGLRPFMYMASPYLRKIPRHAAGRWDLAPAGGVGQWGPGGLSTHPSTRPA